MVRSSHLHANFSLVSGCFLVFIERSQTCYNFSHGDQELGNAEKHDDAEQFRRGEIRQSESVQPRLGTERFRAILDVTHN